MHLVACLLALPLLVSLADPAAPRSEIEHHVLKETTDVEIRSIGLLRARAGHPQRLSASMGWMRTRQPVSWDCRTVCDHRGPLVQVEPGLSGFQVAVGWGHLIGETRRGATVLRSVYFGYGAKAVALRSFAGSPLDPEQQTLVGAEGDFTIASVNFSLSVLHRVSSGRRGDRWVVGWGLGWGF